MPKIQNNLCDSMRCRQNLGSKEVVDSGLLSILTLNRIVDGSGQSQGYVNIAENFDCGKRYVIPGICHADN